MTPPNDGFDVKSPPELLPPGSGQDQHEGVSVSANSVVCKPLTNKECRNFIITTASIEIVDDSSCDNNGLP